MQATDAARIAVLPTGTVTFLFTDIEGSTRLWDQHPDAARPMLARHDNIIEVLVANHSGVVVRPRGEGDSRFAVFRSGSEAVAAACAIQQAFAAESWPSSTTPLRVRIALHTGEAEVRDGDYYGGAVNRCARLRGIAHGGQTLLSGVTAAIVRDELLDDAWLLDLGMHRLKDLAAAEHVFQLAHPRLPGEFPPLLSLTTQLHNLPVQLSSFVGRERELRDVATLLAGNRQLTLTGAGGAGKTRLALQVAAELVGDYVDGVWLVDLAPLADSAPVSQAIAAVLGVREQAGHSLNESLTSFLRSKQLLLVLDNCEHLVQACAELTEELLRACPGIKILATSREHLSTSGEIAWRVPSLDAALPNERSFEAIAASAAVRLFVDRAQAVAPSFQLSVANAASVAEICERLDGMPLALELAAARIQLLSPAQIAARLSDCLALLVAGRRTAPSRQQTLRATFDWSYALLSADEQRLLERVAIFAGGFTIGAMEAVCGVDGMNSSAMLDLLSRLIAKSMVVVESATDHAPRYRLHVPLREYLVERLTLRGELERMRRQHAHYFASLAEDATALLRGSPQRRVGLEGLQIEYDNLRAALRACGSSGETDVELRLAAALTWFWRSRGYLTEGRAWLTAALAHDRLAPGATRARVLDGLSSLAGDQADYDAAEALALECLQIRRDLDDRSGVAEILQDLGILARRRGDRARARELYDELLTIARELGTVKQIASGLVCRAAVHVDDGCLERALSDSQEATGLFDKLDDGSLAYCLQRLGGIALLTGDYVGLRAHCEQSVAIFRELGEKVFVMSGILDLGRGAYETGDLPRARALLEEALTLARELQAPRPIACALQSLGAVSLAQRELKTARELLEQSLAIREIGTDAGIINPTLSYLARIARTQGDSREACTLSRQSLELFSEVTARHQFPKHFEEVGALIASLGKPLAAARLFGAADQLRQSLSLPRAPVDTAEYDRVVSVARAAGGGNAFDRAWVAGAALSIESALNSARETLDMLLVDGEATLP